MKLDRDGVELWRKVIPEENLKRVVDEYEASKPDSEAVPKHVPIVVYRTHVMGEHRKIQLLSNMPYMKSLAIYVAFVLRRMLDDDLPSLRLLETVIFNKPPLTSGILHWHQDVSYFALEPNNQLAVWIPFDKVTKESGAMVYALGSHKLGLRASKDLMTGEQFPGETRPAIDPEGHDIVCMEMYPGDMLVHSGYTWHMSGPNTVAGQQRRGLSLRFLVGETRYAPRPGSAAPFLKQINDLAAGDLIDDPAFPAL